VIDERRRSKVVNEGESSPARSSPVGFPAAAVVNHFDLRHLTAMIAFQQIDSPSKEEFNLPAAVVAGYFDMHSRGRVKRRGSERGRHRITF
jgi:hypothetical protein